MFELLHRALAEAILAASASKSETWVIKIHSKDAHLPRTGASFARALLSVVVTGFFPSLQLYSRGTDYETNVHW